MMQRPTNRRGRRPAARAAYDPKLLRQEAGEETAEKAEETVAAETTAERADDLSPYRACASASDQPLAAGEALSWGQPGWPWQSALPLGGAKNLLLLNLTYVAETDGLAQWTLRLGDHAAAVLSTQVQAYQPVTLMLNTYLPAEADASVTLWNDSDLTLVVQQGSLNLLTLEE